MKAIRVNEWAQPVQLEEIPRPEPAADEVLVKVNAASVNPVDGVIVAGYMDGYVSKPLTLGADFSGEVVAVGDQISHVKPGDAVYGISPAFGTHAEYVSSKGFGVAHKPETLTDVEAAAVPLAGLTAWQGLFVAGQLQDGERVLIHGAGGAVGSFAVQFAKSAGAHVIAHDKRNKEEFVRGLGADEFIAAEDQPFEEVCTYVDLVLDLVPGAIYMDRSFNVCLPGARYVTPAAMLSPEAGAEHGIEVISTATLPTVEQLDTLAEAIDSGKVKVFVKKTFPLEQVQEAMAFRQMGGAPGKVVLTVV